MLYVGPKAGSIGLYGHLLLFVNFVFWGFWFIQTDYSQLINGLPEINYSFMHLVDLIFHEAGHVLFIPFGRFMTILGGPLTPLLMPIMVLSVLLFQQRDTFGAIAPLVAGAKYYDVAPYINASVQ